MDQTCPKCGSNAIIEEPQLGSTFCSLCGHVLNESEIQGELELQNIRGIIDYGENKRGHAFESIYEPRQAVALLPSINPSSFVSLYNNSQELVKSKALAVVDDLLVRLHLPRTYENQVKHLALELFTKRGKWTCGILGQMLIASCVYIVCRQNNKPITLLDVADAIGCNVFKLGEYYRDVLNTLQITINEIDPALFIERALNKLMEYAHEDNNPIDRTAIVNQAIRLVNIAKREWLTVGRKPTAIAAASLLIALQTSSLQKYASIETLASTLQTSVRTIRDRQKELNEILIAIGKQLPWGEQITINNLHLHLSSILKYLEFVHSKTESERQRHENAETNKRPHATVTSSPIESEGSRKRQKNDWKQQPEKHSNLIPAPSSSSSSLSTTTTTTTTSSSSSTTTTPSLLETSSTSSTVSPLKTVATTTVNCFEQLLDSVSLLPPSFRHGQANRMRRVEKIEKAKKTNLSTY
jgi:transcription factor IIIB subunit 2